MASKNTNSYTMFRSIGRRTGYFYGKNKRRIFISIIVIFIVLFVSSMLFKTSEEPEDAPEKTIRTVDAIVVGKDELTENFYGTVADATSITLVAQTAGPVEHIKVSEGDYVGRGHLILTQSTNYSGGNLAAIGAETARKNYELAQTTNQLTSENVALVRNQADKTKENSDEMRTIAANSINATRDLLTTIDNLIVKLEVDIATELGGPNDPDVIFGLRAQLVNYQGLRLQNQSALENLEYSTNSDNPPTELNIIGRDIVYKSTQLQLTTAELSRDIAKLNLIAANINAQSMRVVSPIKGIIEKIYVSKGQYITPGTPVAKIAGNGDLTIDLALSAQTASRIDTTRYANVIVGSQTYNFPITHVSAVPVQGNLYEVIVNVPNEFNYGMSEGSVVAVALPILGDSDGKSIYIPIDTVYVTNQNSFVLALVEGRAAKVIVETGKVSGSSIEIRSGITTGMVIIENRSVAEGEYVKVN